METTNNNNSNSAPINLSEILGILWQAKRKFMIVLPLTLIVTYLLTLCVPRYYSCKIELAPEGQGSLSSGSLSSLASSFGLSKLSKLDDEDAISALLYPDLLKSPNFVSTLFPITVTKKDGSLTTNYYDYMAHHQKDALWGTYIISPIEKIFKKEKPSKFKGTEKVSVKTLSKEQQDVVKRISGNISCAIDKKTNSITLTVNDQDPFVCATVADSVMERMQTFIIEYRTKKAHNDYEYFKKLRDEAKEKYEKSRRLYASMSDANTDVTLQSVQSKITDLENNMQLLYNNYSALATQAQAAQAKIQERTPVFTPITTAVVPVKPAGPKRAFISILVTIVAAVVLSALTIMKSRKE